VGAARLGQLALALLLLALALGRELVAQLLLGRRDDPAQARLGGGALPGARGLGVGPGAAALQQPGGERERPAEHGGAEPPQQRLGLRDERSVVAPLDRQCGACRHEDERGGDRAPQGPRDPSPSHGAPSTRAIGGSILAGMDERALAERLIATDTSAAEGIISAAGFVKGWLEARDIQVVEHTHRGLPVLVADVGAREGPTVVLHGHLDVVPAHADQFVPRVEGERLIGRGAYDMKGGLAAMMCALRDAQDQDRVRVRLVCVPDEESEDVERRSIDALVEGGLRGDFVITGEPTDLHIGVQAKGVLALSVVVSGRSAHGSTPWLGDNAILKAHDTFRRIETLPFSRESSELYDRPSINLARIRGGDAFNKVPDQCEMDVDIRYLPGQDPGDVLAQIRAIPDVEVARCFTWPPAVVSRTDPYVLALRDAVPGGGMSVGRDGSSDAITFLQAGIPAVEFGPVGAGHHGPDEWVSIPSLQTYRKALGDFIASLPVRRAAGADLRAV